MRERMPASGRAIRDVSGALLEHGVLPGEEVHRIVREAEPEGTAARTPVSSSPGSPRDDSWSRTCLATASAVSFTAERGQFVATTDDGASGDQWSLACPRG